jgi:hypothetical protein
MAGAPHWNARTTLLAVQFDWEDKPTPRTVRLTRLSPREGDAVRIGIAGAEVEGVIAQLTPGVVHIRLPKLKMQKSAPRPITRRRKVGR